MCDETKLIYNVIHDKYTCGTMIDVGAFSGGTCKKFVLLDWNVFAFEPNPERYQYIEEYLEKNPDKNKERDVNILNRALAKKFLNDKTYIDDLKLIKNLNVSSASIKMVKDLTKEEIIGQLVP